MYTKTLPTVIDSHTIIYQYFSDDLQLQLSAPIDEISMLPHSMQSCISDINPWATENMRKLDDNRTELMLISERDKLFHI